MRKYSPEDNEASGMRSGAKRANDEREVVDIDSNDRGKSNSLQLVPVSTLLERETSGQKRVKVQTC